MFVVQYSFTNVFLTRKNVDLSEYEISSMRKSTLREQQSLLYSLYHNHHEVIQSLKPEYLL